ncbi:MAG: acetylglutamate kinase [Phycisphaerales bacterium]|nr:acetylglutamate kinase [Phycisphaerales bacterium]
MDSCHEIILHLLHNLGSRREIDQYLAAFRDPEAACFAVVKVGGGVLAEQGQEVASALAFLRRVGLRPVVVHGGGPQLDGALAEAGIACQRIEGLRVTTPEVLTIARRVFVEEGERLADQLDRVGIRARPLASGVFEARVTSPELGLVGEVTHVHLDAIAAQLERGHLPIIAPLGETASGQIVNINADVAARELAIALKPRKIIFLTPTGGLLDNMGRIMPALNLAEDYERLISEPWVHGGMALKLREIKHMLDRLPAHSSVSITSAEHLAKELFTHGGDGTFVQRGVTIRTHASLDGLDRARIIDALEASFRKTLRTGDLDILPIKQLLVADDYRALAIVTGGGPEPYLDKFAVTAEAQGVGIAASLWRRLTDASPRLFWRSRAGNPINAWYFQQAAGMHRTPDWVVFWRGITERSTIEACIDYALQRPSSFIEASPMQSELAGVN